MKFKHIALAALVIAGCNRPGHIEFAGNTPGITNGTFVVKTLGDSTAFGENIKDGKFAIPSKQLKNPGYYKLDITGSDTTDKHEPFEVYLEGGKYTIETEAGKSYKYPKITSPSKIQEQLSAFYSLVDEQSADAQQKFREIGRKLKVDYAKLSPDAYNALLKEQQAAGEKMNGVSLSALKAFLQKYPDSDISAHLMSKLNYSDDPATYLTIFKTLSPAAQNSEEGKEISDRLNHLVKLMAGKQAPAIEGHTPDGKPFDAKSLNKKLILIDFWRAGNQLSRQNHAQIINLLEQKNVKENLAVVSVSFDSKDDWWKTALKDDKLNWIQVADLKGDDSPNAANWNITEIPTYYLLDKDWKIVAPNVPIGNIGFEVGDYLKKN